MVPPAVSNRKAGAAVELQPPCRDVPPDDELVRAARGGGRRAFDQLVDRYQRRATSVAYRLLGDLHDALEVCQEAFVRAYRNLDALEEEGRFGPWLLRIVTNLSLNLRRARGTRLSLESGVLDDGRPRERQVPGRPGAADRPGSRLAATELAERIRTGLAALPERQRVALVLFSVEQLPQKQVADILGCSVEAVKWHVFQARKKMKVCLADYL